MTAWEYKTVPYRCRGWFGGKVDPQRLEELYNEQGRDGWELVSVVDSNMNDGAARSLIALFKRPSGAAEPS